MREAIEPDLVGKESAVADNNVHTDISQHEGGVLRVQGKGGVLRVFLNKKEDGLERLCSNNIYDQRSRTLDVPEVSTHDMLNPTVSSIDSRPPERSSAGATLREINTDLTVESRFSEQTPELEILSLKRGKKRTNMQNEKADSKLRDSTNSNIHKRELKDQLKEILINAGWTIDLRPRKASKYVDSVYIPPKGRGSYWSITKAYAAFQEGLNRDCDGKTKGPFERQSKASLGSAYNIPMDSLNVLKRNVVNKRKRKEAPEEVQSIEKKKSETMFDPRRQPRVKETTEVLDELVGRKNLNNSLDLDSKTIVSSVAHNHFQIEKNKHRVCALLARRCDQDAEIEANDFVPYKWKRTVFSWMIDLGILSVNGKVKYMNRRNETKLKGWITRDGIKCICCTKIVSASKFELHAGSKLLRPSQNIYLEDRGVSLLQCQLEAWKKHEQLGHQGFCSVDVSGDHPHDDTCAMCGGGDELICCNDCPSTSHLSCLGMEMLRHEVWHCKHCCCRFCGDISADATQKSNGIDSSLLSCNQCEAKYHQDCAVQPESVSVISSNLSSSFCTQSCKKIFEGLQKIWGTKNDLGAGFSWSIIRRFDKNSSMYKLELHQMAECNLKIAIALAIMDECFLPIVDQRSGFNLIHNAVYNCGSNFSRLNYSSFCTIILERGDEIISVASVRIHGTRLAEMPFIGTRNMYRRQGMCRRLLGGIESVLCSLNVEKLVIPTIPELKDAWTNVFGFKPLDGSQEQEVRSTNILVFPGTDLLEKPLLKMLSPEKPTPIPGDAMVENDIKQQAIIVKCSGSATAEHNLHASCQAAVNCVNAAQAKPTFEEEISTGQKPGLIREITMAASQERE